MPRKNKLEELYQSGLTQKEVGRQFGVSQKVIFSWFRKLGLKSRVPKKLNQWGSNNHMWKADNASYDAFHIRLKKRFGTPKKCDVCGTTDPKKYYDWANLTGNYQDIKDYKRMCRSCHSKFDNKVANLK